MMTMSAVVFCPSSSVFPISSSSAPSDEDFTIQQQLQIDAFHTSDPLLVNDREMHLAAQLSHLASQHHTSEYNIVKFGARGSPLTYVPLSIQLPSHIKDLKRRQWASVDRNPWWLACPPPAAEDAGSGFHRSPRSGDRLMTAPSKRARISRDEAMEEIVIEEAVTSERLNLNSPDHTNGVRVNRPPSPTLQRELNLAITSHLHSPIKSQQIHFKTSKSHPINISPIIPTELLPIISAHLQPSDINVSTVFDLPPSMHMDRLTLPPSRSTFPTRTENGVRVPMQRTLNLSSPPPIIWNPNVPCSPLHAIESPLTLQIPTSSFDFPSTAVTTQPSDTRSALPRMPFQPITQTEGQVPPNLPHPTPLPVPLLPILPLSSPPSPIRAPSSPLLPLPPPPSPIRRSSLSHFPPPVLGNLLLSSCPGKKVRLTGPVKGRGAICRDLASDLERIRNMGVGCIVCCLDDNELDFLGAGWSEYSRLAKQHGIDVLRVPMPEGLSPHAVAPFNYHLDTLIQNYTLRGVPVLVHCRGGVGRAGLVACCWMIKIGLCGWIDSPDSPTVLNSRVRVDTLDLVEKVIVVIRRRRSVKAIETYEQVKFLVEFVEFLRGNTNGFRFGSRSFTDLIDWS